uniref:Putative conserved secreted protein n=1 Tax=Lutzomyia longipalpis TaxID=7200 RepID=A0A1B0GIP6_LUTLO
MKVSWVLFVSASAIGMACITYGASTNATAEPKEIIDIPGNATKILAKATVAPEKDHQGGRRAVKNTKKDTKASASVLAVSTVATKAPPTPKPKKVTKKEQIRKAAEKAELICPKNPEKHVGWFALPCTNNKSCLIMGKKHVCCKVNTYRRCIQGVPKPIVEPPHEPILGIIQQKCPTTPLAELFWNVQTCDTDADCWPRVCCPDGQKKYCRNAAVELQKSNIPFARSLANPLEAMSGYIQCTPPPSPLYDLYPKPCNNTLDCFPNVCCQEKGGNTADLPRDPFWRS